MSDITPNIYLSEDSIEVTIPSMGEGDFGVLVNDGYNINSSGSFSITTNNDVPYDLVLSNKWVLDTASNGDVVGIFTTIDANGSDTFTYTLTDDASGRFTVVGDQLRIADNGNWSGIDNEYHTITVESQDIYSATISLSFDIEIKKAFTITNVTDLGYSNNGYNIQIDFDNPVYERGYSIDVPSTLNNLVSDRLIYNRFIYRNGYIYAFNGITPGSDEVYTNTVGKYKVNNGGDFTLVKSISNSAKTITHAILGSDNNIYFTGMDYMSSGSYFTAAKLYQLDEFDEIIESSTILDYRGEDLDRQGIETFYTAGVVEFNGDIYAMTNFFNSGAAIGIIRVSGGDMGSITQVHLPDDYVANGTSITEFTRAGFLNLQDKLFIVEYGANSPNVFELTDIGNDTWTYRGQNAAPLATWYLDAYVESGVGYALLYSNSDTYYRSRDMINWTPVVDSNLNKGNFSGVGFQTDTGMNNKSTIGDDQFLMYVIGGESLGSVSYDLSTNSYIPISKNFNTSNTVFNYYGDNNEYVMFPSGDDQYIISESILPTLKVDGTYTSYDVTSISEKSMNVRLVEPIDENSTISYQVENYFDSSNIYVYNNNSAPTGVNITNDTLFDNEVNGFVIGDLSAVDVDGSDTHTFTLLDDASGRFNIINGNQLAVADAASIDGILSSSHNITVQTEDNSSATYNEVITINVTVFNYAPTDMTLTNYDITDDMSDNDFVANVLVSDLNLPNDTHNITMINSAGGVFKVVSNSIYINDASTLDAIANSSYVIEIRATDNDGLFFNKEITINVNYVNYGPTDLFLSNSTVSEGVSNLHVVGLFSTQDQNPSDTYTYTLDSDDLGAFIISGDELRVMHSSLLDAEYSGSNSSNHNIVVTTRDNSGEEFQKGFIITVSDIDEAPTMSSESTIVFDNAKVGDLIATMTANDQDFGGTITAYDIISGNDGAKFSVTNNNGVAEIYLDKEVEVADGDITLVIEATDNSGMTVSNNLYIQVKQTNIVITSIDLVNGDSEIRVGEQLRITGSGFNDDVFVIFNGVPTKIDMLMSQTELLVTVPNGSTSGPVKVVL
jgi:hypothetical protein